MADEMEEVVSSIDKLTKVNEKLAAFNEAESQKQSAAAREEQLQRIDILKQEIAAGDGRTREIRALKAEMLGIEKSIQDDANNNAQILANSAAALGMTEEQFRLQQKAQADADKTNANLEALGKQLMSTGIKPEDLMSIEAYAKASADSAEKQEEVSRLTLANQPSASAQEEIDNKRKTLQEKMQSLLGKVAGGIGGLLDQGKERFKKAIKNPFTALKALGVGALAVALIAFLNSPLWEKTKSYIVDVALPKLMNFYENTLKPFGKGIADFFSDPTFENFKKIFDVENPLGLVAGLAGITALLAPGLLFKGLKLGFIAMKTALVALKTTLLPILAPLLPAVATVAVIGAVLFALKTGFDNFRKTLEETGSIFEALKVGAASTIGFLFGLPFVFINKVVGFIAGLFGFEGLKEKLNAMNPIQFFVDVFKNLFDGIGNFFKKIVSPIGDTIGNITDMAKDFLKTVLRSVLPKPGGSMFSISGIASRAIPKGIYEFAGMNPETGELIAPVVTNAVAPNPAMAGNVAGRPNFQSLMDTRARQMTEAKLDKATGGSTVVVDAKSTNVVNSNSTSSATFTNTSMRNPNPTVAALNVSH
tara:strand:- start:191 stop:1966 length:1776 start_codon:yes stop_codon:yes gene_type:complete